MREKYGIIAELLRHFYAILSTAAANASRQTKTTASNDISELGTRLDKLVQRLLMHKDTLKRKLEYIDSTVVIRHDKLSCRAIAEDMIKLLERAENKYKDYQNGFRLLSS